jgi:hypothetical protein
MPLVAVQGLRGRLQQPPHSSTSRRPRWQHKDDVVINVRFDSLPLPGVLARSLLVSEACRCGERPIGITHP